MSANEHKGLRITFVCGLYENTFVQMKRDNFEALKKDSLKQDISFQGYVQG